MPLVTSLPVLSQYIVDKITAAQATLGHTATYYGDQDKLPVTPAVCVEASDKTRTLNGVPRRVLVEIDFYVIVYHNAIQSVATNRKEADELTESLETLLHADRTLNGQVIHSLVTRVESGYAQKQATMLRASRITFTITSQEQLPQT